MTATVIPTKAAVPKARARAGGAKEPVHADPSERIALGAGARAQVGPDRQAEFAPAAGRPDPVSVLEEQGVSRVQELLPLRYGRMLVSPFTYYRGAAAMMAADLATTPASGLMVQACGDAHLSNFGLFGSPERRLMFDVNDFDETCPGPWEWDLKRLTASLVVAARGNNFNRKMRRQIVAAAVGRYQAAMKTFSSMNTLDIWYAHLDLDRIQAALGDRLTKEQRKTLAKTEVKARTRDSMSAYKKLVGVVDGRPRIIADPPLIDRLENLMSPDDRRDVETAIRQVLARYRRTLPSDRRILLEKFVFGDIARKVVGVGSVGTRCWIVLLFGRDGTDPLFLQVKEAQPSVLAPYVTTTTLPTYRHHGERVVAGQRLMQAASDIFLGWDTLEGIDGKRRDFYVRQLRDWKGSAVIETMLPTGLAAYGEVCAWTLARAHARSGDPLAISTYLGDDDAFAQAMVTFSELYADQNELDHAALVEAARSGRIETQAG